jgi:hypothetical protein
VITAPFFVGVEQGDPTCLKVVGNTATFAWLYTTGAKAGAFGKATIMDNGEPRNGTPDDVLIINSSDATGPDDCATPANLLTTLQSGNYTVRGS